MNDKAPDYFAPVIGFKTLQMQAAGRERVVSPYRSKFEWFPEKTADAADCRSTNLGAVKPQHLDAPPSAKCQCGYYAWYELESAQSNAQIFRTCAPACFEFVSVVEAWGEVVLHKEGLRSQYMRIAAIHDGAYPLRDKLRKVTESLGVPFLNRNELLDFAAESGVLFTPESV